MAAADAVQQRSEYAIRSALTQREASHDSHAAIATAASRLQRAGATVVKTDEN
jgi:hypothetical protein